MEKKELDKIIERHQHWLDEDRKGWEKMKADLSGEDLPCADLHEAELSGADLSGANLSGANLSGADLSEANLCWANLRGADLRGADLSGADLSNAKLEGADLSNAKLFWTYLADAVMDEDTALDGVIYNATTAFFNPCCPEEGSFVAFKKAIMFSRNEKVIVKLQVPDNAQRSSATSRMCRVSEAKVVSITSLDGKKSFKKAMADYEKSFIYEVGKKVKVDNFDPCRWHECAPGIHCFITRDEAVNY